MLVFLLFSKPVCWPLNHYPKNAHDPERDRKSTPSFMGTDEPSPRGPETMALIERTGTL